jgi:two-component system response regulator BaeR
MGEHVLLVEDDVALREVTAHHVASAGYDVTAVGDGESALESCEHRRPGVVVLDLMLPGRSGLDVCRELRGRYSPTPGVVMITARGSDADLITGFDAGADDYVVKPFAPQVLLARLTALVRRLGATMASMRWGTIEVDSEAHRALVDGAPLALTPTELALLAVLVAAPGRVFSRRELLERVFSTSHDGYARNVDCHVTRLRRKLESAGLTPAPIHGVRGAGYRLGA